MNRCKKCGKFVKINDHLTRYPHVCRMKISEMNDPSISTLDKMRYNTYRLFEMANKVEIELMWGKNPRRWIDRLLKKQ